MPVRIEPHAEPIPGYKLIERLGSGGFGEVWKAEAPGGLLKAIKFVHGDLEAIDDAEGARAGQELKAMDRVRRVRHAYILSIERFEIIEGQLIIVTELADRTLWDRFKESNRDGLRGIPRVELLNYLGETAEALDFMIDEYDLQHLDIKPQNLFLVHKHVKVADFGLAKDLGGKAAATVTGGVTPVYAAPETFDGWLSRFSDQYSLAIVYQELLTGKRPFNGGTMRQLVMQHLQGVPDLSDLPSSDKPVVARALAKNPEHRFPNCMDFVKALRDAAAITTSNNGAATLGRSPDLPGARVSREADQQGGADQPGHAVQASHADQPGHADQPCHPKAVQPGGQDQDDTEITHGFRGKAAPISPPAPVAACDKPSLESQPQVLPPRPGRKSDPQVQVEAPKPSGTEFASDQTAMVGRSRVSEHGRKVYSGQPALVIGLGKLGLNTLQQLRQWLSQEVGPAEAVPRIRLLGIDTDPEAVQAASQGSPQVMLRNTEVVLAKLHRPSHYLKTREGKSPLDSWLNGKLLYRIPRQQDGAGLRALGRLALVDNFRHIARRLQGELQACTAPDTPPSAAHHGDLAVRKPLPRVYIVTGLGGNTGSGMFLDIAYLVRHALRNMGLANAEVVGLFFLPLVGQEGIRSNSLANSYAALMELEHFSSGQIFSARYEGKESGKPFTEAGAPFQRALVLPLPDRISGEPEPQALLQAGQFLYRDLATNLGVDGDEGRPDYVKAFDLVGRAVFQSFGLHRIYWPRRRLREQAARNLCRRLLEGWMSKDARAISPEVRKWSLEQWDSLGLRAESLIARHQEKCEHNLKQAPERLLQNVVNPLAKLLGPGSKSAGVNFGPVVQAMDQIDRLLSVPEECRPPGSQPAEPGDLDNALADAAAAVAEETEQKLAETIVRLIERPTYRLAGAEECLRQFCDMVEQALQAQEQLARELQERSVQLHQRITALVEKPVSQETKPSPLWTFGRKTPTKAGNIGVELLDLLKAYPKCRYQSLILSHINRLYVALRGLLSDQIREVGFCRQRLGELAGILKEKPREDKPEGAQHEQALLPQGCGDLAEALAQLQQQLGPEDFLAFERQVQALIEKDYRALVQVCLGPSHVVKALAPAMIRAAETFLEPRLQGVSIAEMFLHQPGASVDKTILRTTLEKAFAAAEPSIGKGSSVKENAVVVLPAGPAGAELETLVKDVLPTVKMARTQRYDEILIYREKTQLTAAHLEQLGPIAQEAYRQKLAVDPGSLHTREDIDAWQAAQPLELARQ